jgi:exopolysaccharide production protein ExoQ
MRRTPGPLRAPAPPNPRPAARRAAAGGSRLKSVSVRGGASLVLLAIAFWLIFYQNAPPNWGLNWGLEDQPSMFAVATTEVDTGNTEDRIIKVCTLLISLYVVISRWSVMRSLVKDSNLGAIACLALCPISAAWSIEPSATLLRSVTLLTIALLCLAISLAGWHRQRLQQLVLPPLMFILIFSLVLGLMFPDRIIETGNDLSQKGAWHGFTFTKNQFGMMSSLAAIICINRWMAGEGRIAWPVVGTIISFVCLVLSRSNTSLFATLLAIGFMVLVMRVPIIKQRFSTHVVVGIAATILLYELVIQNVIPGAYTLLAPVRSLTGKDATFSARTTIWDIVKQHIQYAPLLGTGYGAYWIGPIARSPSFVFTYVMFFYPTEAHNGYLDFVNDFGWIGLGFLMVFLIVYMRQALQLMRFDRSQATVYLALLFQQMVMNMSESEWFARDSTFTIMLLAATCLSRSLREARASAQSAPAPAPAR